MQTDNYHFAFDINPQRNASRSQQPGENLTKSRQFWKDEEEQVLIDQIDIYRRLDRKIDWPDIAKTLQRTEGACQQKYRQIRDNSWNKEQDLALIRLVKEMSAENKVNWEKIAAMMKFKISGAECKISKAECEKRFSEINENALNYHCGQKSTMNDDYSNMKNQPNQMR